MRLVRYRKKWAVVINGKRLSTGVEIGGDRGLAEWKAREIVAAFARKSAGKRCGEIMNAYVEDMPLRANPKTPGPGLIYAKRAVTSFFGGHLPEEVTREECRAYVAHRRAEGRSDGTIRKELSVLAAALRWRDPNTPARFDMPAPPPARDRWLTKDEFNAVLEAADLPHIKTFLHVAICTGARKEAILTMQWDTHVNFERRTLWPGFKSGGKARAMPIPMTDDVYEWLTSAKQDALSPWLVEWAGENVKDVKRALKSSYLRAGIENVGAPAHVLRHTAGAWMALASVPMLEISRRLGHSSVSVTERHYAHLHPDYMGASTKALELGR